MNIENLIVGCGLSGIVLANRIANELNEDVLIIDKKNHIGGTCYDFKNEFGITIHKYGPHIFRTDNKEIWDYLSKYTEWKPYIHKVHGLIDGIEVPIPFNLNSLYLVFSPYMAKELEGKLLKHFRYGSKTTILELRKSKDDDLKLLADFVYEKVYLNYTIKQWDLKPEQMDGSVIGSVPINISRDDRYFRCKYQGMPLHGYSEMFNKMLNNKKIKILLQTDYKEVNQQIKYKRLFYTGSIDEYFDYLYGELPYRSVDFKFKTYLKANIQNTSVLNYPNNYDFTRSTEYKKFLDETYLFSTIGYEYPLYYKDGENERIYPIINGTNSFTYSKYLIESEKYKNIYFLGRLGSYKYLDMERTIKQAFEVFLNIK